MRSRTLREVDSRVSDLIAQYEHELNSYEEERADYVSRSKGRRAKEMAEARKDVSVLIMMTESFIRDLKSLRPI